MIGNSKLFIFTVGLLVIVSCESITKMTEKRGLGKRIISLLKGKSEIKEENTECDGENESNVVTPNLNSTEAKLIDQATRKKGLLDFWKNDATYDGVNESMNVVSPNLNSTEAKLIDQATRKKGLLDFWKNDATYDGVNASMNVVTPNLNSTEAKLIDQATRKKGLLDFWKNDATYVERPHLRFWRPSFVTPKLGNTTQGNETEQRTQGKGLMDFLVKHDRTPGQREYLYSRFLNSSFVTASLENSTRKNMTHQVLRSKGIFDLFKRETTADPNQERFELYLAALKDKTSNKVRATVVPKSRPRTYKKKVESRKHHTRKPTLEPAHVEDDNIEFSPMLKEDIPDNDHPQLPVHREEGSENINKDTPARKQVVNHRCEGQRKVKKGMLSKDRKKPSKGIIKNNSHGRPTEKGEKDQGEGGNTVPATECCPNEIKSLFPTHN